MTTTLHRELRGIPGFFAFFENVKLPAVFSNELFTARR